MPALPAELAASAAASAGCTRAPLVGVLEMKLPLRIDSDPAWDWGFVFLDSAGEQVDPQAVVDALNATQPVIEAALLAMDPARPQAEVRKDYIRLRDAVDAYKAAAHGR